MFCCFLGYVVLMVVAFLLVSVFVERQKVKIKKINMNNDNRKYDLENQKSYAKS